MSLLRQYIRNLIYEMVTDVVPGKKMIFMAGAPGSGKSTVLKQLNLLGRFSIINPDDWYEPFLVEEGIPLDVASFTGEYFDIVQAIKTAEQLGLPTADLQAQRAELRPTMSKNAKLFNLARRKAKEKATSLSTEGKDFIIDGTGGNLKEIMKYQTLYKSMGYDTAMVYISVPLETSLRRNFERGEKGGRRLLDYSVEKSHSAVSKNKEAYMDLFGRNFFFVDNSGTFEQYKNNIELIRDSLGEFLQ